MNFDNRPFIGLRVETLQWLFVMKYGLLVKTVLSRKQDILFAMDIGIFLNPQTLSGPGPYSL